MNRVETGPNPRKGGSPIRNAEFQKAGGEGRLEMNPNLFVLQTRNLRFRAGRYGQGHKGVRGQAEPPAPGERGPMGRVCLPPHSPLWSEGIWAKQPPWGQSEWAAPQAELEL